jgi:ribonuclease-3
VSITLPNYIFKNKELLETALTHRSAGRDNYERLEFLGDSTLGFIITETLYQRFEELSEGDLTRLRANLVRKESLAKLARALNLGDHIKLGTGERKSGGWRRDSILSNTLEALIGAVYLDSDIQHCRTFVLSLYKELLDSLNINDIDKDPKSVLQELLQSKNQSLPVYHVVEERGDAHNRVFTVSCALPDVQQQFQAEGKSKRAAEQAAAEKALQIINVQVP